MNSKAETLEKTELDESSVKDQYRENGQKQTPPSDQDSNADSGYALTLAEIEDESKKIQNLLWSFKDVLNGFRSEISETLSRSVSSLAGEYKDLYKQIGNLQDTIKLKTDHIETIRNVGELNSKVATIAERVNREVQDDDVYIQHIDRLKSIIDSYSDLMEKVSLFESKLETFCRLQKSIEERKEQQRKSLALPGSSAIIRSQELERQRIAREIHDGPAQAIANVIFRLDIVQKMMSQKPDLIPEEMTKVKEIAQGALNEIRHFIFDLRPMTLQDLGLTATLKKIIQTNTSMGDTKVDLLIEGEECELDPSLDLAIFRIAQESLNNIKKHAHASHAWVQLKYLGDKVVLIVEDDGCGYDLKERKVKSINDYQSYGLLGMQERADDAGGTLQITSQPMRGTKIIFTVPLRNKPTKEG